EHHRGGHRDGGGGRRGDEPDDRVQPRPAVPGVPGDGARLRGADPAGRDAVHPVVGEVGGGPVSVQSVLFDAPGPRGRVRNTVIGVAGVVVCLGLLAVLLYGLRAQLFVAPPWLRFLEPVTWTS